MRKIKVYTEVKCHADGSYEAAVSSVLVRTADGNIENAIPPCKGVGGSADAAVAHLEELVLAWAEELGWEAEIDTSG